MRNNLLHFGTSEQNYEIREIVEIGNKIESFGIDMIWENIGDPINKGEKVPDFVKKIIENKLKQDSSYAYSPSKGVLETRQFLAQKNKKIKPDDIIFFNGLGEAINKIYGYLSVSSRVLGPEPAYPTHSSAEATNSGSFHLTYRLNPDNNWNPDLEEIENKVRYNPNVSAILVINPDNPTGAVFSREVLVGIISIAKKYDLFVIFDEIYEKLVFEEKDKILLEDIIGDLPGISMKGLSKEVPWPGSRCGWIEVYNQDKDENFSKYIRSIYFSKMLEVCSTTLPQAVLPDIYNSPEFEKSLRKRVVDYKNKSGIVSDIMGDLDLVKCIKPKGAFYFSIVLNEEKFGKKSELDIKNKELRLYIEKISKKTRLDKKFCYYLMASRGICVVPLSGFNSSYSGFRMTLLEQDIDKFKFIVKTIKEAIIEFSN